MSGRVQADPAPSARLLERLTALQVRRLDEPGWYPDGGGLYLQVSGEAGRSWVFRYWKGDQERRTGLGPLHSVTLSEARGLARDAQRLRLAGLDSIDERRKREAAEAQDNAVNVSFDNAVDAFIEDNKASWRNDKHVKQWKSTLTTYASPHMGGLDVSTVETSHVLLAIKPIWASKAETASRVRGRIENVIDWATAHGHREGDNPARWKGHLDKILPAKSKVRVVKHHAALPFSEIVAFMTDLAAVRGVAARALEFTILTIGRTNEILGGVWEEIDLAKALWTIPGERMKGGKEHRVHLSAPTIAIFEGQLVRWRRAQTYLTGEQAALASPIGPIFPGLRPGRGLSNMSLLKVLKDLGRGDLTTHGFGSTFRDWAAETRDYPGELVEMALAHTIGNKVEAAYRRGDLFEKRRTIMDDWAATCFARAA